MKPKRIILKLIVFLVVQLIIVLLFLRGLSESKSVTINDTKQVEIKVDNVFYFRGISEYKLIIYSNTEKYLFDSRSNTEDYSIHELKEAISTGDKLSIVYYDGYSIYGKIRRVVDARTETIIYRSFDNYNKGRAGSVLFLCIIFVVLEVLYLSYLIIFVLLNKNLLLKLSKKGKCSN